MAKFSFEDILYQIRKKEKIEEFDFDKLTGPGIYNLLYESDLQALYNIATSVKYAGSLKKKFQAMNNILQPRGFTQFHRGTNRVVYKHYEHPEILIKTPIDLAGCSDGMAEFKNQNVLKPFVTKVFDVHPSGVSVHERVIPLITYKDFIRFRPAYFRLVTEIFLGRFVMDDIGEGSFMNWGFRQGFGLVLLDYPYLYELDYRRIICQKINPTTGMVCGGEIDYDDGFNNIVCKKCGCSYNAKEIGHAVKTCQVNIIKEEETNMGTFERSFNIVNNGKVVGHVGNSEMTSDVIVSKKQFTKVDNIRRKSTPDIVLHVYKAKSNTHEEKEQKVIEQPKVEKPKVVVEKPKAKESQSKSNNNTVKVKNNGVIITPVEKDMPTLRERMAAKQKQTPKPVEKPRPEPVEVDEPTISEVEKYVNEKLQTEVESQTPAVEVEETPEPVKVEEPVEESTQIPKEVEINEPAKVEEAEDEEAEETDNNRFQNDVSGSDEEDKEDIQPSVEKEDNAETDTNQLNALVASLITGNIDKQILEHLANLLQCGCSVKRIDEMVKNYTQAKKEFSVAMKESVYLEYMNAVNTISHFIEKERNTVMDKKSVSDSVIQPVVTSDYTKAEKVLTKVLEDWFSQDWNPRGNLPDIDIDTDFVTFEMINKGLKSSIEGVIQEEFPSVYNDKEACNKLIDHLSQRAINEHMDYITKWSNDIR